MLRLDHAGHSSAKIMLNLHGLCVHSNWWLQSIYWNWHKMTCDYRYVVSTIRKRAAVTHTCKVSCEICILNQYVNQCWCDILINTKFWIPEGFTWNVYITVHILKTISIELWNVLSYNTAILYAKCQHDWASQTNVLNECIFARFEINKNLGEIYYTASARVLWSIDSTIRTSYLWVHRN